MGAVYKASDRRLEGRLCAVKEILPTLTQASATEAELEQMSEQFRLESSILARLDHPTCLSLRSFCRGHAVNIW